jgi:hypothetical protein
MDSGTKGPVYISTSPLWQVNRTDAAPDSYLVSLLHAYVSHVHCVSVQFQVGMQFRSGT